VILLWGWDAAFKRRPKRRMRTLGKDLVISGAENEFAVGGLAAGARPPDLG